MNIFYLVIYITLLCFPAFSEKLYEGECLTERLTEENLKPLGNCCRIILLRHAETDWNAQGKSQGWTDIPLNEEGRRQALDLAEKLSAITVKTVYASALSRATETAEILAAFHEGAKIIPDPALRFFRQEGMGKYLNFFRSKKTKKEKMFKEVIEDSTAYLKNISLNHPGETVFVVTHARVIKYLLMNLEGRKRSRVSIKNSSITRVIGDGETLSIER